MTELYMIVITTNKLTTKHKILKQLQQTMFTEKWGCEDADIEIIEGKRIGRTHLG